jgi:hypothetical protein
MSSWRWEGVKLNNMKTKLLYLLCTVLMALPNIAFASEITVQEDLSAFKWTGTDTRTNVKFVCAAIDGNPENGFFVTVEPINANAPAAIDATMMADENFWTAVFERKTQELAGERMQVYNNVHQITVTNVTMCENLFSNYSEIHKVTLNWTRSDQFKLADNSLVFAVPEHHTNMDAHTGMNIYINYTGNDFVIGNGVFPTTLIFSIHSENQVVGNALLAYKTANNCRFEIDAPTSVGKISADEANDGVKYNLAGQRIGNNYKGIAVKKGKKVVM